MLTCFDVTDIFVLPVFSISLILIYHITSIGRTLSGSLFALFSQSPFPKSFQQ